MLLNLHRETSTKRRCLRGNDRVDPNTPEPKGTAITRCFSVQGNPGFHSHVHRSSQNGTKNENSVLLGNRKFYLNVLSC